MRVAMWLLAGLTLATAGECAAECVVDSVAVAGDYRVSISSTGCEASRVSGGVLPAASGRPDRAYFDIAPARLGPQRPVADLPEGVSVRLSQYRKGEVRIALDLPVPGKRVTDASPTGFRVVTSGSREPSAQPSDVKPLALPSGCGRPKVVVDAGHGGKDPGALGVSGLREKEVNFEIASEVASLLRSAGVDVLLTRNNDSFVELRERAAFANRNAATAFVSVHANASLNRATQGVETYHLGMPRSGPADRTNQELASPEERASLLQAVLETLMSNDRINDSALLSGAIQKRLSGELSTRFEGYGRDLGVKQAPFAVLVGTKMPAALVETGFLTSEAECGMLAGAPYRKAAAYGIAAGVIDYLKRAQCEPSTRDR